jgi:hypothetical protein
MTARGRIVAAAAVGATIGILALVGDQEALVVATVPALARTQLAELDRQAGLRDATGASAVSDPVAVDVALDGPAWLDDAVTQAVANDDVYVVRDGPHRILGELVVTPPVVALRLSLERRGWVLHATPARRRLQPALAILPALAGIAVWAWSRRLAWGVALAGVAAQIALAVAPWPSELAAPTWLDELGSGPVGARVVSLAAGMDDTAVALAAGLVALTAVLAFFDHRRRAGAKRQVPAGAAVLGVAGALAWVEAAGRASVGAWVGTALGLVATALALLLVVLVVVHHRRVAVPARAQP